MVEKAKICDISLINPQDQRHKLHNDHLTCTTFEDYLVARKCFSDPFAQSIYYQQRFVIVEISWKISDVNSNRFNVWNTREMRASSVKATVESQL